MSIDEAIARTATPAVEAGQPYSVEWWEGRTPEELRDIIKRGFSGGDAFQGAVAEAERRARIATRRLREEAARAAAARKKRVMLASAASVAVALAVSAGVWFSY